MMKHVKSLFGVVLLVVLICVLALPGMTYAQAEKAAPNTKGAGAGNTDAAVGAAEVAGEAAGTDTTAGVEAGTIAIGAAAAAAVAAGAAAVTSSGGGGSSGGSPAVTTTTHH
jgi:hypothetical protein